MSEISIDAKGMKCPRPIIELAKAKRKMASGDLLTIEADDLAFESDVKAWCDTTGCILENLSADNGVVTAAIKIQ